MAIAHGLRWLLHRHGHAKCHFVATDIFTGKKLEDLQPSSHNSEVGFVPLCWKAVKRICGRRNCGDGAGTPQCTTSHMM